MNRRETLSVADRFQIFEKLHLHQHYIDNDASIESVEKYQGLYWPEATFFVHDLRDAKFDGYPGLKKLYDYAHSVFPLHKWRHSVGSFEIDGSGDEASVPWRWTVMWRAEREGVVSTGTYVDRFQKRGDNWKCLTRKSDIDPNWPVELFRPLVDKEGETFTES